LTIYTDAACTLPTTSVTSDVLDGSFLFFVNDDGTVVYDVQVTGTGLVPKLYQYVVPTPTNGNLPIGGWVSSFGFATFQAAHAAAVLEGRGLLVYTNLPFTATSTYNATASIWVVTGGSITQMGSSVLAIGGPFRSDGQAFSGFSAGQVTGLKEAYPEWFGAVGGYTKTAAITDDSAAINATLASTTGVVWLDKWFGISHSVNMTGNYDSATGNYIGQRLSGTNIASTGLVALAGFADQQMVYIGHAAYGSDGKYCIFNQLSDMTIDNDNVPNDTSHSGVVLYGTFNNELRNLRFGDLATPFTHWDLNITRGTYTTELDNIQGSTLQMHSDGHVGDITTIAAYSTSWTFINIAGVNAVSFYATTIQGNAGIYSNNRVQISNSDNVKFDGGDLEGTGTYFTISVCNGIKIIDNNVAMPGQYTNGGTQTSIFINATTSSSIASSGNIFENWAPPGTYFEDSGGNAQLALSDFGVIGSSHMTWGAAAPTTGTWSVGDVCWKTGVTSATSPGWVCTNATGSGTWTAMPNL
jgi:hypothetical protein